MIYYGDLLHFMILINFSGYLVFICRRDIRLNYIIVMFYADMGSIKYWNGWNILELLI